MCVENTIASNYDNNECPDCGEIIPSDFVEGDECINCGHVFCNYHESD